VTYPSLFRFPFKAFGGPNEVQLYAASREDADLHFRAVLDELLRIEKKYSRYEQSSIISAINRQAGTPNRTRVDDETAALLDYAAASFETSDHLFDITSGVLSRAWDFTTKQVPRPETLKQLLHAVGWEKVVWARPEIALPVAKMEIDFGGFGKEYAVDRAAVLLMERGVQAGLVNLGGDLRVIGPHPDGSTPDDCEWHIGISHPRSPNAVLTSVRIRAGALATSGDYERSFEVNGKRYCHIIDPRSGYPVESFQSVSVFSESCLVAGSSASTAMLLGEIAGEEFLRSADLPFICVRQNGEVISEGIAADGITLPEISEGASE